MTGTSWTTAFERAAEMRRHRVMLLCCLFAGTVVAAHALEVPFLAGRVNDNAGILSPDVVSRLETSLKAFEDSTSNQVVVLTIPSLEGEVLEEYSYKVASTWKLGQKGKDNGVLLLVARDDRKVRIEVGSGLEGDLTDLECGLIIRHAIVPQFKAGNMDAGVEAGVNAMMEAIQGSYTQDNESSADVFPIILGSLIFFSVVGLFTVIAVLTKGFASWFLFVFLIPFWVLFPGAFYGYTAGGILSLLYVIGFPICKVLLKNTKKGRSIASSWGSFATSRGSGGGSSGGSSFS
jgi:uncharacterized protein